MSTAKAIDFMSVNDYLESELLSDVKREYFDGRVYAMPATRNIHNTVAGNFLGAVDIQLCGRRWQAFNTETKIRVRLPAQTRFYYPDGMIVAQSNHPEETFQDFPVVIAEVIANETRRTDEVEKKDAYLTIPSLTAYVVIETARPRIVVHRRGADGTFAAELYEGLDAVAEFEDVGCSLRLDELYQRVDFSAVDSGDRSDEGET